MTYYNVIIKNTNVLGTNFVNDQMEELLVKIDELM